MPRFTNRYRNTFFCTNSLHIQSKKKKSAVMHEIFTAKIPSVEKSYSVGLKAPAGHNKVKNSPTGLVSLSLLSST